MAVITISRQVGTHGARIARALAQELGYEFADKSLINKVIRQYGLTRLNLIYDRKPKIWELFDENSTATIEMMNQTIAAIAARGNVVILGRGGYRVLADMADVLNVFVRATDAARARRVGKRDELGAAEAAELVKADDELRARFVRLFYGADWADESAYDLVVDTSDTPDAEAVAQIVEALQARPAAAGDARQAAHLTVDPVLADTVDKALADRAAKD
ncbi:MAG: cytidylate kinase-like family protein [Propionibacteriaceae bacterium]|nr:cytidylate kinase-like family protein [Propionibacteriaceae bacterium]